MIGTHARMLEAIEKGINIAYVFKYYDQAAYYYDKAIPLYGIKPRENIPRYRGEGVLPNGVSIVRFIPLDFSTYDKLLGFSGCIFLHPDTGDHLYNPEYDYKNVQELIVLQNTRNRPWRA